MRWIFLAFESTLTVVWFWATWWMLTIIGNHDGDYGTVIGMLLFLAFAVGTAWMLVHEIRDLIRQRSRMQHTSR